MKPAFKHWRAKAFTLIELLVVIVVIVLLAALVLRAANYVQTRSAMAQCKAELAMFATVLDEYFKVTGRYPTHGAEANCNDTALNAFYDALITEAVVRIDWPAQRIANRRFLDPWGTPYCYHKHIDYRPNQLLGRNRYYNLGSAGPDRLWGTIDDISDLGSPAN